MPRKAKPTKHSSKSLAAKAKAALTDRGGGAKGAKMRNGGTSGGAKFKCYICMTNAPSEKSMIAHFEGKHSKLTLDMSRCMVNQVKKDKNEMRDRIAKGGPSAVAGKRAKNRKKEKVQAARDVERKARVRVDDNDMAEEKIVE